MTAPMMTSAQARAAIAVTASVLCATHLQDNASGVLLRRATAIAKIQGVSINTKVASLDLLIDDACELVFQQAGSTASMAALHAVTAYRWYLNTLLETPELGLVASLEIIHAHAEACRELFQERPVSNSKLN